MIISFGIGHLSGINWVTFKTEYFLGSIKILFFVCVCVCVWGGGGGIKVRSVLQQLLLK